MWISKVEWRIMKDKIAALEKEQVSLKKYVNENIKADEELIEIVKELRCELATLQVNENEFGGGIKEFTRGEPETAISRSQYDFSKQRLDEIQELIERGQANTTGCQGVILARIERKRREQKHYAIAIILLQMITPLLIALAMR